MSCCRLIQDDNIQARHLALLLPERLPYYALQSVSPGCEPTVLFADSKPQSWLVCAVRSVENCKHLVAAAAGFFKDAAEGGFVGKPASLSEAAVHVGTCCCLSFRSFLVDSNLHALRRKLGPTFGATAL